MVKWRSTETRDNLFSAVNDNKTIIVYDLETTGLNAEKSSIIQISALKVRYDGAHFAILDTMNHYINPEIPIPSKITEITGITDEMVVNCPTEKELFPIIQSFFGDNFVASGYNIAKFDNRFMQKLYSRNSFEFAPLYTVDVMDMAHDNVDAKDTENFKLGTIFQLYFTDTDISFHNAMDDVKATTKLLEAFYNEYKSAYEEEMKEATTKVQVSSVTRIAFWEGYKGFSRLYITTNIGEFYLDIRKKLWGVKKGNPYDIDEVDMFTLRNKTFEKAEVNSEAELIKKYTPHTNKVALVPTMVNSIRRWERTTENGKIMKRIYITTDVGNFFYDIINNRWASNADSPNEVVDVDSLKTLVFEKAGVSTEAEFANFR